MDIIDGYTITRAGMFEDDRGFALGENHRAPEPFSTWQFVEVDGQREYSHGLRFGTEQEALKSLDARLESYGREHGVEEIVEGPRPDVYKYYSTQRPVDIGTFPKNHSNRPQEVCNYDGRIPVEGGAFLAWGELTYGKPLTETEVSDYELRPSSKNPDIWRRMDEQAQTVGQWEDDRDTPDTKRLTWYYPDFGSYVAKDFVTPEKLAACFNGIVAQRAARAHKRQPPIAEQLKEAGRLAQESRGTPAPKKDAPDHGDR
ncbi:MAG: hypothetical protein E6123_01350 [Clostridiales bacterium]|nr:hypothetical protein [Clostridiales bacterium]